MMCRLLLRGLVWCDLGCGIVCYSWVYSLGIFCYF